LNRRNLLLKMELRSNPETLCAVRGAVAQLTERLGFSEQECRAAVLGIDEALTNIIRHAYAGHTGRPIAVHLHRIQATSCGKKGDALEIVLEDRGKKADPAKLCGRALEDVKPGGLGLHFIRKSMDTLEFRRKNGRNQLRLVKFLPKPEPPAGT